MSHSMQVITNVLAPKLYIHMASYRALPLSDQTLNVGTVHRTAVLRTSLICVALEVVIRDKYAIVGLQCGLREVTTQAWKTLSPANKCSDCPNIHKNSAPRAQSELPIIHRSINRLQIYHPQIRLIVWMALGFGLRPIVTKRQERLAMIGPNRWRRPSQFPCLCSASTRVQVLQHLRDLGYNRSGIASKIRV